MGGGYSTYGDEKCCTGGKPEGKRPLGNLEIEGKIIFYTLYH
jgi:hypothetical protein